MTQRLLLVFLLFMATSCQFFDTEKVSSEELFEEEIKTINWKDIDRYPVFSNCENALDKIEQQSCFITTVTSHLHDVISGRNLVAGREITDTLDITFEVDNYGNLIIEEIKMDSLIQKEFPDLRMLITNSMDSLQPDAPAYKRGIPVRTKFRLPIIIQTD